MRYMTRDFYRPDKYALKIFKESLGIEIYIINRELAGRKDYLAIGWTGKQQIKPAINCYYSSEAARQAAIERVVQGVITAHQHRKTRQAERNQPHTLKVGDILDGIWGYEQTNVEFYQVVEVPSSQYVMIRKLAQVITEETGYMQGRCMPAKDQFIGESLRRKVSDNRVKLHDSCGLSLWDGKQRSWSSYA